jgi:hypothetical protein
MKKAELDLLRQEYKWSKEQTTDKFHDKWVPIMDEYGLKSFDEVLEFVTEHLNHADMLMAHDASVGKFHLAIRKMLTLVSFRNPEFHIRNENPKSEAIAELLDASFPHELRRVRWPRRMRMRNLWALLTGFGMTKIGVSSIYHYDEPAYTGKLPHGGDLNEEFKKVPYGPTTEYMEAGVEEGEANLIYMPSTNIFTWPWDPAVWEHVQRLYIRYQRPLIDIYYDDRYENSRQSVSPIRYEDRRNDPYFVGMSDEHQRHSMFGEVVECYDFASRKWCVFNENVDRELRDWTNLGLDISSPFTNFVPIESTKTWRGIPYAIRIINQAHAVNQLRGILKSKIASDGKTIYFYDPMGLSPEDMDRVNAMRDGEWMAIPGLAEMNSQGKDFIRAVEFGKPQPELLQLLSTFDADLREMSGLDNPAVNAPASDQTATEVSLRSQQTNLDIRDYITTNEESQEEVAADFLRILLQKWPQDKILKVTGLTEQSYFWVPVTRQDLLKNGGSFSLEIVAGSTEKLDKTTYRRQFTETMARIVELSQQKLADADREMQQLPTTGINWDEMIRSLLDLFDPTLSKKLMKRSDPAALIMRLAQNHGILPAGPDAVSPDIAKEIEQRLTMQAQGQVPGNVTPFPGAQPNASFESRTGNPAMAIQNPQTGMAQQDGAQFPQQRALSEGNQ